uniref:Uncharacterized protein n=1 Tax=Moniliophthora roreri TaxID=221103 RepID=A0A0W0F303_MONRR
MSTQSLSEKAPRKDSKYTQGAFFLVLQVEAVEPPLRPATSFSSPLYPESTSSSQNIAPNVAHKGYTTEPQSSANTHPLHSQ